MATLKAVYPFSGTLLAANLTVDIDLSAAVNQAKSIIIFTADSQSLNDYRWFATPEFVDNDTVRIKRDATGDNDLVIQGYVLEFTSGVTVEIGEVVYDADPDDITLSGSFDTSKSWPIIYNRRANTAIRALCSAYLVNSTTLRLSPGMTGGGATCRYQVVQYDTATANYVSSNIAALSTSQTDDFGDGSWTADKNLLFFSIKGDSAITDALFPISYISSVVSKQTTTERNSSGTQLFYIIHVINFSDTNFLSNNGREAFGVGDTSRNVTLGTTFPTDRSAPLAGGFQQGQGKCSQADNDAGPMLFKMNLTGSTTLNLARAETLTIASTASWQMAKFPLASGNWPLLQMKNELYNTMNAQLRY